MSSSSPIVTFVIPCYNESTRLAQTLHGFVHYYNTVDFIPADVIFVNDGSKDDTAIKLDQICTQLTQTYPGFSFTSINYTPNKGKGWALKQGIDACKTPWVLTLDADLSTPPVQLMDWLSAGLVSLDTPKVYIGSRELGGKAGLVESSWIRRTIGLVFNFLVRKISGLNIIDTQCGFKLYPTVAAQKAFTHLTDYGFVHDVEVLLNVRKEKISIHSLPLLWVEMPHSKVNVVVDSLKMLKSLIKIRFKRR